MEKWAEEYIRGWIAVILAHTWIIQGEDPYNAQWFAECYFYEPDYAEGLRKDLANPPPPPDPIYSRDPFEGQPEKQKARDEYLKQWLESFNNGELDSE